MLSGYGNSATGSYSVVVGGDTNAASGEFAIVGSGRNNTASGTAATIGGGGANVASGYVATIGGGSHQNATGYKSTIAGGTENTADAINSTIGGGISNAAHGADGVVAGGNTNQVTGQYGTIGGGGVNTASGNATISGGYENTAGNAASISGGYQNTADGSYSSVLGGNLNSAAGSYSVVLGGYDNSAAGDWSLAAGYHSQATYAGDFVWSDADTSGTPIAPTGPNQFISRAEGGYTLYTNRALSTGVTLAPGSGTWASTSDRRSKTDIVAVDDDRILAKVVALPVTGWRYRSESGGVRHIGPMAQDFHDAFGVGPDDRHITAVDEDGVALAAIKALHAENARLRARLAAVTASQSSLDRHLARLDEEVRALAMAR